MKLQTKTAAATIAALALAGMIAGCASTPKKGGCPACAKEKAKGSCGGKNACSSKSECGSKGNCGAR